MNKIKKITVFCGSNVGNAPAYTDITKQFAKHLVEANIGIVYGGRTAGLMGVLADEALRLGGEVIGVIPDKLAAHGAHPALSDMHIVSSMHERKVVMTELADAFVMLPGGVGSLDEFFEVTTLSYLEYHEKPASILNVANYFNLLIDFLSHSVKEGFITERCKEKMIIESCPLTLLQRLQAAS